MKPPAGRRPRSVAAPIFVHAALPAPGGGVVLFQHDAISEALYDAPFYWMWKDEAYRPTFARHRGEFTERFTARWLRRVFGAAHVHLNVQLERHRGKSPGEVDVLVVFGDRLIIVQAKSKRLTLDARRGNDGALKKDFASAIQTSYDQALVCAEAVLAGDIVLRDESGAAIELP